MKITLLSLFLCLFSCWSYAEDVQQRTGRLLVNVDPKASFSAEEFARATSSQLVTVDPRNPFKAFDQLCLNRPFLVISAPVEKQLLWRLANDHGYRLLIFVDESLETAVSKVRNLLPLIPHKSSELPYTSLEKSRRIYALMDKIDRVFTENHITWWAGGGTLLGAIRHGGLIPWDDDLDLYMLDSDVTKLKRIQSSLEEEGLKLHYYFKDIYKIYESSADPIPDPKNPNQILPFGFPTADIFIMTLHRRHEKSDVYVHKSRTFYWEWNNDHFHYSQIQNIHRVPFGPLMIPIPGDPESNLNRIYGTSEFPDLWKKYAPEPTWDHSREIPPPWLGGVGSLVEIDDFSPAPWQ